MYPSGRGTVVEQPIGHEIAAKEPVKEVNRVGMVGQKTPDFAAPGYKQGQLVNVMLSDHLGNCVLLCFSPEAFSFVGATEISAVAEKYQKLQEPGVEVLFVSIDSMFVHKMWDDDELKKMVPGGVLSRKP